jgi:hypothetical protein
MFHVKQSAKSQIRRQYDARNGHSDFSVRREPDESACGEI